MKDSGIPWIGMIPEEWEICRLKDVGNLYGGLTGKAGDDFNVDEEKDEFSLFVPFTNIFNNDVIDPLQLYKVKTIKGEKQNEVTSGDILFLMSSEDYEGIGKTSLFEIHSELPVYLNSFCKGLRVNTNICYPKFLNYLMSSKAGRQYCQIAANGFIRINLRQEMLSKCPVICPPFSEQEAIASWLDEKCGEIDELIEVEQKMIEELEAYRQATITETVTRGLNPDAPMRQTGISWLPEIPEHWSDSRLKYLTSLITDGTHITPNYIEHGVPFLSIKDISSRRIDFTDTKFISEKEHEVLSQHAPVKRGDILFARIGTLGIFVKVDTDIIFDIFVSLGLIKPKTDRIYTDFLVYYLSSSVVLNYINSVKAGGGTSAAKFNLGDVAKTYVIVPPLTEQLAIANYLDTKCKEIDELIAVKREKIETLKQYRQSIIFEAVTGKIHVC